MEYTRTNNVLEGSKVAKEVVSTCRLFFLLNIIKNCSFNIVTFIVILIQMITGIHDSADPTHPYSDPYIDDIHNDNADEIDDHYDDDDDHDDNGHCHDDNDDDDDTDDDGR